jgi:CheY-like chemotaxis protein
VKRVLEGCDVLVLTANNAQDALRLVEQARPDVLVSDIGMPVVDGYMLLKQIRAMGKDRGGDVPAIALTAFARPEDRTRALLAGYLVHITKPIEASELIATVASLAGRIGVGA